MSGAGVAYRMRPHKAVDRRLFVDLLTRIERWQPLDGHVYISMGGYSLEDHKLAHRVLGLSKLISFDMDEEIVARQTFNRPLATCRCIKRKSGEIVSALQSTLVECEFDGESGIIAWLDYTDPKKIGSQVREFEALLASLRSGDVVRVTVNSHPNAFGEEDDQGLRAQEKRERQFQNLKKRIGDYIPSNTKPDHMTLDMLPQVLVETFASAAAKALPPHGGLVFSPLSLIRYADEQQMLSITGIVVEKSEEASLHDRLDLALWPFASENWKTIHRLVVPDLTVRERMVVERGAVGTPTDKLKEELGFGLAGNVSVDDFLLSYRDYYRFYPTLLSAEL